MKRLSDYVGEEAIELWMDLLDPLSAILKDNEVRNVVQSGQSKMVIAKTILKAHQKEAVEIMLRIDPEPINGLNIIVRLIALVSEIGSNEEIKSFFGFAEQVKTESESSTYVTENIEVAEN